MNLDNYNRYVLTGENYEIVEAVLCELGYIPDELIFNTSLIAFYCAEDIEHIKQLTRKHRPYFDHLLDKGFCIFQDILPAFIEDLKLLPTLSSKEGALKIKQHREDMFDSVIDKLYKNQIVKPSFNLNKKDA